MDIELSTVADDLAVVHVGADVHTFADLRPDTSYEFRVGDRTASVHTLARPSGERLATLATVNDLHLGETVCGAVGDDPRGPRLSQVPGARPYPDIMSSGAIAEITALRPTVDVVVAKGDLTDAGRTVEFEAFGASWGQAFDGQLVAVRGNHDHDAPVALTGHRVVDLPGLRLAVLDTVVPGIAGGQFDDAALDWLASVVEEADRPVLVIGHHPIWHPHEDGATDVFKLDHAGSVRLIELVAGHPRAVAYLAGHTHRNLVRHVKAAGATPFIEVACLKDFPGSWAEYRVYEGGILQVHHRVSTPEALAWSERCRVLYADFGVDYTTYALGRLEDRCLTIALPPPW